MDAASLGLSLPGHSQPTPWGLCDSVELAASPVPPGLHGALPITGSRMATDQHSAFSGAVELWGSAYGCLLGASSFLYLEAPQLLFEALVLGSGWEPRW